jgi:hypothetical protein
MKDGATLREVPLADDSMSGELIIDGGFSFYGRTRTSLWISSNGFVTFDTTTTSSSSTSTSTDGEAVDSGCCDGLRLGFKGRDFKSSSNTSTGSAGSARIGAAIAPFWTDLDPSGSGSDSSGHQAHVRAGNVTLPSGKKGFLVQFERVPFHAGHDGVLPGDKAGEGTTTWQLLLFCDGSGTFELRLLSLGKIAEATQQQQVTDGATKLSPAVAIGWQENGTPSSRGTTLCHGSASASASPAATAATGRVSCSAMLDGHVIRVARRPEGHSSAAAAAVEDETAGGTQELLARCEAARGDDWAWTCSAWGVTLSEAVNATDTSPNAAMRTIMFHSLTGDGSCSQALDPETGKMVGNGRLMADDISAAGGAACVNVPSV